MLERLKKIKKNKLNKILLNKKIILSLFFLALFQLIASSSNIWMAELGGAIIAGEASAIYYYFGLFVCSLWGANIPDAISAYYLNQSKLEAIQSYTKIFTKNYTNTPTLTTSPSLRGEKEPWLTNESDRTIDEAFNVLHRSLSLGLYIVFNIGSLVIVLDSSLLIGYSLSLLSIPLVLRCFRDRLEISSLQSQTDRKNFNQLLLSGWENITIGNEYNFNLWWKQFILRFEKIKSSSGKFNFIYSLSNASSLFAIMFPVIANISWLINSNINNPVILTTVVATLSRQIGILFNVHGLLANVLQWKSVVAPKLEALVESNNISVSHTTDIYHRIKLDGITARMNNKIIPIEDIDIFINYIKDLPKGRITLEGENGTGKSTLLCLIKEKLQSNAFYLPASSQLIFNTNPEGNFSSGQKMQVHLNELFNLFSISQFPQVLLLDEWDANLDKSAILNISQTIDKYSHTNPVVEVRHNPILEEVILPQHNPALIFSKMYQNDQDINPNLKTAHQTSSINNYGPELG